VNDSARAIPPEDAALIMYSGGLDSTVSAIQMAERFRRVILMTVDYAYTIGLKRSMRNVGKLQAAFPQVRIEHRIVAGDPIRKRIWAGFCDDYFTYCKGRGLGISCLGCKIAMMTEGIKLCLAEGVGHMSNGMTRTQVEHPHCMPRLVNRFGDLMAEYNITYINDVYDMPTRADEEAVLDRYGLDQGLRIGASSVTHQPRCFIGPPTKLWLMTGPAIEDDMVAYFDRKVSVVREILAPLAARREALRGRPEMRTRVDESFHGEHHHEFGPRIDRLLGLSLSPIWWAARVLFSALRRRA